jgi:hypothetical protein
MASTVFNPDSLRAQAERARKGAATARQTSAYPLYGESVYLELAAALEELARIVEETAADCAAVGIDRQARQTRRAAWLKRKAAWLKVQSVQQACGSHDIASRRPFGQPILIGHHSERAHRRDLERQHAKERKAYTLHEQARETERRARACERNTAIYRDDTDALDKLRAKIAAEEAYRDQCKALNAEYRRCKGNLDAMQRISEETRARLKASRERYYLGAERWQPAEAWQLKNAGAEIRRLKERLADLEGRQSAPARPERSIGPVRIVDNPDFQKVEVHFPGKPSLEVIAKLKQWGFRWVRSAGCWSRGINEATEARLHWLAEALGHPLASQEVHP